MGLGLEGGRESGWGSNQCTKPLIIECSVVVATMKQVPRRGILGHLWLQPKGGHFKSKQPKWYTKLDDPRPHFQLNLMGTTDEDMGITGSGNHLGGLKPLPGFCHFDTQHGQFGPEIGYHRDRS